MDSRKPLTAGEDWEVVRSRMVCCDNDCEHLKIEEHGYTWFCEKYGNVSLDRTVSGYEEVEYEAFRCSACLVSSFSMLTPPPDAAVREAVERLDAYTGAPGPHLEYTASGGAGRDIRTLLRAVQAPRLTPEQVEAVKMAETLLTDTMSDYGDCEHDVGHCICKYHSGVFSLRSAFPDLFTGEVGRG